MSARGFDWSLAVERATRLNRDIAEADVHHIWNYGSANSGADGSEIQELERHLGYRLDAEYTDFLKAANGWPGFYNDVDLLSASEVSDSEKADRAWILADSADEGSGGALGLDRGSHMPIAVAKFDIDVFMLFRHGETVTVRWIAGQQIESFPSVSSFFEALVSYNEETLRQLREDPWLGAS